ncbi:hypothetical protein GCM10017674_37760 [Streptomyces gardneri]|uniref:Uncharacterized protein n=1 Tax=Streptomyces gardneri TaxID=66892 RepID=A0A4Y3RPA3_9ACTN|nr:hypothetical protein SGA01_50070 [Streptomyces gardneri]GHH01528.1 hypothetical protein GCM10017674_37760 [Streptomyces gardneri]
MRTRERKGGVRIPDAAETTCGRPTGAGGGRGEAAPARCGLRGRVGSGDAGGAVRGRVRASGVAKATVRAPGTRRAAYRGVSRGGDGSNTKAEASVEASAEAGGERIGPFGP